MAHAMSPECWTQQLKETLSECESPFSWNMPTIDRRQLNGFILSHLEKSNNIEEENDFKWTSFNLLLLLAYELWQKLGDIVNALHYLNSCREELIRLTRVSCAEQLFTSIQGALWHVTWTTRAHLLLANKQFKLALQTMEEIRPVRFLRREEQAGLLGIKAAVFKQYNAWGHRAIVFASQASLMDPDQAEWHFIIANCLGRGRRAERGPISPQEISEMEHAFSLKRDATYTSHLAQVFADFSEYNYYNRKNKDVFTSRAEALHMSKVYATKAVERFKEALLLRPHCPGLKVRIAHGLLKIHDTSISDIGLAKQLLDEALVHMPNNPMLHYDQGRYFHKIVHDPQKAIESLLKAHKLGNYPAFLYLVRLWWRYSAEINLISEIKSAMDQYTEDYTTAELMVYLGAAYLLLRGDWATAVQYFLFSIQRDPAAKYMKKFCGFFWRSKHNLMEVVINELQLQIKEHQSSPNYFNNFMQKVSTIHESYESPLNLNLFQTFKD